MVFQGFVKTRFIQKKCKSPAGHPRRGPGGGPSAAKRCPGRPRTGPGPAHASFCKGYLLRATYCVLCTPARCIRNPIFRRESRHFLIYLGVARPQISYPPISYAATVGVFDIEVLELRWKSNCYEPKPPSLGILQASIRQKSW